MTKPHFEETTEGRRWIEELFRLIEAKFGERKPRDARRGVVVPFKRKTQ